MHQPNPSSEYESKLSNNLYSRLHDFKQGRGTINVPISTEGSGTPTMRPKTGCPGQEGGFKQDV